jgi:hypothetical protein
MQILKACGVDNIVTVNVLEDQHVREGIKEYSNWPTIPQLYVKGEFIGGSDIMGEMFESGELKALFEKADARAPSGRRAGAATDRRHHRRDRRRVWCAPAARL